MTGSMIVNNLAGLMMLTSLFVISVKSYRLSCGFYACQSLVLVSIFATLSCLFAAEQLLIWSASAFITKVLLVPLIMTYAARNIPQNIPEKALFGPAMMALLARQEAPAPDGSRFPSGSNQKFAAGYCAG